MGHDICLLSKYKTGMQVGYAREQDDGGEHETSWNTESFIFSAC